VPDVVDSEVDAAVVDDMLVLAALAAADSKLVVEATSCERELMFAVVSLALVKALFRRPFNDARLMSLASVTCRRRTASHNFIMLLRGRLSIGRHA